MLCLCCLQNTFLPLVETLPFWWICRYPRLPCKGSSSHHWFGMHYLCSRCLQTTFLPLVKIFPFWWICRCPRLPCKRSSNHHWFGMRYLCSRCLQTTFLPLVKIFPFWWICHYSPRICRVEDVYQWLLSGCLPLLPQEDGEWWLFSRFDSKDLLWIFCVSVCSILLRGEVMGPTS